jgi:hypothetical protein
MTDIFFAVLPSRRSWALPLPVLLLRLHGCGGEEEETAG